MKPCKYLEWTIDVRSGLSIRIEASKDATGLHKWN